MLITYSGFKLCFDFQGNQVKQLENSDAGMAIGKSLYTRLRSYFNSSRLETSLLCIK